MSDSVERLRSEKSLKDLDPEDFTYEFTTWLVSTQRHFLQSIQDILKTHKSASHKQHKLYYTKIKDMPKVTCTDNKYSHVYGTLAYVHKNYWREFYRAYKEAYKLHKNSEKRKAVKMLKDVRKGHEKFEKQMWKASETMRDMRTYVAKCLVIAEKFGINIIVPCAAVLYLDLYTKRFSEEAQRKNWKQYLNNPGRQQTCVSEDPAKPLYVVSQVDVDLCVQPDNAVSMIDAIAFEQLYQNEDDPTTRPWSAECKITVADKKTQKHARLLISARTRDEFMEVNANDVFDKIKKLESSGFSSCILTADQKVHDTMLEVYDMVQDSRSEKEKKSDLLRAKPRPYHYDMQCDGRYVLPLHFSTRERSNMLHDNKNYITGKYEFPFPSAHKLLDLMKTSSYVDSHYFDYEHRSDRTCCVFTTKLKSHKNEEVEEEKKESPEHLFITTVRKCTFVLPFSVVLFGTHLYFRKKLPRACATNILSFVNAKWFVNESDLCNL